MRARGLGPWLFWFILLCLLRLLRNFDGTLTAVHWKRNDYGYVGETWTDDNLKINRATVKKYILESINLFRAAA